MYRIQKTNPAFSLDASTAWHVLDEHGNVVHHAFLRREARAWINRQEAAQAAAHANRAATLLLPAATAAGLYAADPEEF